MEMLKMFGLLQMLIGVLLFISFQCLVCQDFGFEPNYKKVLGLSLLFYEAQRSGKLPEDNRIPWRGDSALEDKGRNGEDLTGGYYDASDYVKFGFTMAFTTTILSWGLIDFQDGYQAAKQLKHALNTVKWATDYFIKCHTSKNEFYGQVGDFPVDHEFWGRPEDMTMPRPAYKIDEKHPGSDLAGEASAAFSSASIIFKPFNETYSNLLLSHSKELFSFATNFPGLHQDSIPGAKEFYESTSYEDELVWAALWLFKATKDRSYLDKASGLFKDNLTDRFFYNEKTVGIQLLLAEEGDVSYRKRVEEFCRNSRGNDSRKTPKGLLFLTKFGTLAQAANVAFVCLKVAGLGIDVEENLKFAKEQIDYALGSSGRSYLVGYGDNYPKKPYNAASSCPNLPAKCGWEHYNSSEANPQILYGALVSGPDQIDNYQDSREEFLYNDVTLDFNAGFQSALAGLIHHQLEGNLV